MRTRLCGVAPSVSESRPSERAPASLGRRPTRAIPRLAGGGFTIVDDYGFFAECRQAVHDHFDTTGTEADARRIDDDAVFWQNRG